MLVTLIPLFDENMVVKAYSLFTQRDHYFHNPQLPYAKGIERTDNVEGLDLVNSVGLNTLAGDKELFITLNEKSVFTKFEDTCEIPQDRVVFIIDNMFPPDAEHVERLRQLKAEGYRLAIRKLEVRQYQKYQEILQLMDYMFLDHKKINISSGRLFFTKMFPAIKLCAGNLDTREAFEKLKREGGYQFFEGPFYRTPITEGQHEVVPLKINYIELLNMVNKPDYDLVDAASIITRDTALALSLLKVVNKMARNSEIGSIRHAAAMLGQKELRRWINAVVTGEMCSDKPNEITRLSLLRAKFSESLAAQFELSLQSSELFLMGLFSVVDLILDMPMREALDSLKLSREIRDVLIDKKGNLAPVYEFILAYSNADWEKVSEMMEQHKLDIQKVYNAYLETLEWYRDLFG